MRVRIHRGERPSKSARALGKRIGAKVLNRQGSKFRPRPDDVIINWGASYANMERGNWINPPLYVGRATNKLQAFCTLEEAGVCIPDFSTDIQEAFTWLEEGRVVIERHQLRASEGRGIRVVRPTEMLRAAPLYTSYFKARDEYRIHVARGEVFDRQQKRKRREEEVSYEVRNHAGGWVFCREDVDTIPDVDVDCARAVSALGLDFGAVDVKVNKHRTKWAILEVNTAPGLEGTTLDKYADAIAGLLP